MTFKYFSTDISVSARADRLVALVREHLRAKGLLK